jgi:hypothetical protein
MPTIKLKNNIKVRVDSEGYIYLTAEDNRTIRASLTAFDSQNINCFLTRHGHKFKEGE